MRAASGQAALVTGAAKRLGRAMALALASRGFDIAIHYHSSSAAARVVADEAMALGVRAAAIKADFLREAEVASLVSRARDALGSRLTVLVNNASIFENDSVASSSRANWDRHFESNLRAPFVLTQRFAAQVAQPSTDDMGEPVASGCIVNLVDQRVVKPTSHFATYTVSKMALWALTQTTAISLAPRIRVNAIGPGPTLPSVGQDMEHFTRQRRNTMLKRGTNPEDVVAALLYFVESPALTGQLICVDAGQRLSWRP